MTITVKINGKQMTIGYTRKVSVRVGQVIELGFVSWEDVHESLSLASQQVLGIVIAINA